MNIKNPLVIIYLIYAFLNRSLPWARLTHFLIYSDNFQCWLVTNFIFTFNDVCNFHSVCARSISRNCVITRLLLLQHLSLSSHLLTFIHTVKATVCVFNYMPMPFSEEFTNNSVCSNESVERKDGDANNIDNTKKCFRVVNGEKNIPTATHAGSKRRPKWLPGVRGYSWATLRGVIHTVDWSSRLAVGRQRQTVTC
jgi:hypothetical protein